MIVRLDNEDGIWVPTPKLFFDILDKASLELATEDDKNKITDRLNSELEKKHGAWFFNINLSFNVKSSKGSTPCNVRILKSRVDDGYSGCIVFATKSDLITLKDFDYEFKESDL